MVFPLPALAPVIPPVTVPTVQVKLLVIEDVRLIFGLVPLQMKVVGGVVTVGAGLTVTVREVEGPAQTPVCEMGVTIYSTVPAAELLGLVKVWLIDDPAPGLAPEILPVTAPIVQEKLLSVVAVKRIEVVVPLQIAAVVGVVTFGAGLTVTTIE